MLFFTKEMKYSLHGTHTETLFLVNCKLMSYVRECILKLGDQFSPVYSKDIRNGFMKPHSFIIGVNKVLAAAYVLQTRLVVE